ncbi:hypothetical protein DFP73DRAFT_594792 [Morchella snyderi]|nr:hypothetical protein DFP73DRAFT_594792 [Morchella snyderi]
MAAVNQQPSFDVIAGAMNNISRSHAILATHFDRIPNVPAFDGGALILAELRAMREDIGLRFEDVSQQLDEIKQGLQAADFNSVARLENSFLARTADSPLSPLKTA